MGNSVLIIIALIAYIVLVIRFFAKAQRPTDSTVEFYSGGLGTGKTLLAVKRAVKIYKRIIRNYNIRKFFGLKVGEMPQLISNIPIKWRKNKWSIKLLPGHLLGLINIPEGSVVLIDELGNIISQHDYDNPVTRRYILPFMRLFRHWIGGKLILTDQTTSSVVIDIRRRINIAYNLSKLSKKFFGFVYKINYFELVISEDIQSVVNSDKLNENYFAGFFPIGRLYESRTFKKTYPALEMPVSTETYSDYYTDYYIDFEFAKTFGKKIGIEEFNALVEHAHNDNDFIKTF